MPDIHKNNVARSTNRRFRLVNPIPQRRRRAIVQQPERPQPGDRGGVDVAPTLQISEVGRNSDHAVGDALPQALLRDLLQMGEEHGHDLDRRERPRLAEVVEVDEHAAVWRGGGGEGEAAELVLELWVGEIEADEALDVGDGGPRVHGGGGGAGGTDEALLLAEGDDGGVLAVGFFVQNDVDAAVLNHRDDAVVIADVEADDDHRFPLHEERATIGRRVREGGRKEGRRRWITTAELWRGPAEGGGGGGVGAFPGCSAVFADDELFEVGIF